MLILLTSALSSFAKDGSVAVLAAELKGMSFTRVQMLRSSYISFIKGMEQSRYTHQTTPTVEFSNFDIIREYFEAIESYYSAYAASGDICYFGGWPSKMSDQFCEAPWKHRGDGQVQSFGPIYDQSMACGSPSKIRCNPVLFGDAKTCINITAPYKDLTTKCEEQTKDKVSDLVNQIRNNPDKRNNMAALGQSIDQFCDQYKMERNKDYDACDALRNRIAALLDTNSTGQVDSKTGLPVPYEPPAQMIQAQEILNSCRTHLDDRNGRGIVQTLSAGIVSCVGENNRVQNNAENFSLDDIEKVAEAFTPNAIAKEMMLTDYEQKLRSIMAMELSLMSSFDASRYDVNNKEKFLSQVTAKFPNTETDPEYLAVFNKVFAQTQELKNKGLIKPVESSDILSNFETLSSGIHKECKRIYEEFTKEGSPNANNRRNNFFEGIRSYSDEENQDIARLINDFSGKLNSLVEGSQVGFLLGTNHFRDNILDPTIDYASECLKDGNFNVMSSNISDTEVKTALGEASDIIDESFNDLAELESDFKQVIDEDDIKDAGDDIVDHYLKNNKHIVTEVLLKSDAAKMEDRTKYLCQSTLDIDFWDNTKTYVSWVGAGLSAVGAVVSGVSCVVPAFSAVACPTAVKLATTASTIVAGTAIAGGVGTAILTGTGVFDLNEGYNLEHSAMLSQIQDEKEASEYLQLSSQVDSQITSGYMDLAGGVVGGTFTVGARSYGAYKAGKGVSESGNLVLRQANPDGDMFYGDIPGTGVWDDIGNGYSRQRKASELDNVTINPNGPTAIEYRPTGVATRKPNAVRDAEEFDELFIKTPTGITLRNPNMPLEEAMLRTGRLKDLGSKADDFTDDIGQMVIKANASLTDVQKAKQIDELYSIELAKGLNQGDVYKARNSILEAHTRFPCTVHRCTQDQIKAKLLYMKMNGVPNNIAKDSIRRGLTGYTDEALDTL